MANRRFDKPYTVGIRRVYIAGSFGTNGSSAIDATKVHGFGFGYAPVNGAMALIGTQRPGITTTAGIVRSGTGQYDITFDDSYSDLDAISVDLMTPTATSDWAGPGPVSNLATSGSAPTIRIWTYHANSAADIASNASSRVEFIAIFRDSSDQFNKP